MIIPQIAFLLYSTICLFFNQENILQHVLIEWSVHGGRGRRVRVQVHQVLTKNFQPSASGRRGVTIRTLPAPLTSWGAYTTQDSSQVPWACTGGQQSSSQLLFRGNFGVAMRADNSLSFYIELCVQDWVKLYMVQHTPHTSSWYINIRSPDSSLLVYRDSEQYLP